MAEHYPHVNVYHHQAKDKYTQKEEYFNNATQHHANGREVYRRQKKNNNIKKYRL